MTEYRKKVRHFHEPGDLHELTFSCFRRRPLLINDLWRELLCRSIDRAINRWEFRLVAFVFMPEHVHLLVYPTVCPVRIDALLAAIKQPYSARIRRILEESRSSLLSDLMIQERPGKISFRYWQEGPGYDRNLSTEKSVMAAIEYIHLNPVRRRLVGIPTEWRWSSASWYASNGQVCHPDLPIIHGLPYEFFT